MDVYGVHDDIAVGIRLVLLMSIRQLLPAGDGVWIGISFILAARGELPASTADGFERAYNPASKQTNRISFAFRRL